jgi:ribosomal protein L14E/L6E/L27E
VNIQIGSPVIALAGRDKGSLFVAVGISGGFVYIADGRKRKLEKPKRKNVKHISPVGTPIEVGGLTNKSIRRLINEYMTHTDLQQTKNL